VSCQYGRERGGGKASLLYCRGPPRGKVGLGARERRPARSARWARRGGCRQRARACARVCARARAHTARRRSWRPNGSNGAGAGGPTHRLELVQRCAPCALRPKQPAGILAAARAGHGAARGREARGPRVRRGAGRERVPGRLYVEAWQRLEPPGLLRRVLSLRFLQRLCARRARGAARVSSGARDAGSLGRAGPLEPFGRCKTQPPCARVGPLEPFGRGSGTVGRRKGPRQIPCRIALACAQAPPLSAAPARYSRGSGRGSVRRGGGTSSRSESSQST